MDKKALTKEQFIYGLIFILAITIRLYKLGFEPLSNAEAALALDALSFDDAGLSTAPSPLYIMVTGLIFYLFGSGETLARILPALAGALLIWAPYLLRHRLGWRAAMIMAGGLAIDPVLVAVSRTGGGEMLALATALFALLMFWRGQWILAGVLAALGILSGPTIYFGVIIFLVISRLPRAWVAADERLQPDWRAFGIGFGVTFVLVGTLFFQALAGLGGTAGGLVGFLQGWIEPSGVPWWLPLLGLAVYGLMPLLFTLIGIQGRLTPFMLDNAWLIVWFFAALALAVVYPGRDVGMLAWVIFPLWGLAGHQLDRFMLPWRREDPTDLFWVSIAHAGLICVFLANFGTTLAGMTRFTVGEQEFNMRILVALGGLVLVGLTTSLIALITTTRTGLLGLLWGGIIALSVYTLATAWPVSPGNTPVPVQFWDGEAKIINMNFVTGTVSDLSEFGHGDRFEGRILSDIYEPSLVWALRNYPAASFVDVKIGTLSTTGNQVPDIVVTERTDEQLGLADSYRGQPLTWQVVPDWSNLSLDAWFKWIVVRKASFETRELIIWGRSSLFPDDLVLQQIISQDEAGVEFEEITEPLIANPTEKEATE